MSDTRTTERPPVQAGAAAVLLATAGPPAAWGDTTILGRLRDQLRELGVEKVLVITRPQWKDAFDEPVRVSAGPEEDLRGIAAFAPHSALLVAHADLVLHRSVLAGMLADPRPGTVALVGEPRPFAPRVRERHGRIVSAASPYHAVHDPDHAFLGVLKVAAADRAALAAVAERLGALLAAGVSADWEAQHERRERIWRRALLRTERRAAKRRRRSLPKPRPPLPKELSEEGEGQLRHQLAASREDVASLLLTGLVREGHGVGARELRALFWARPLSREEAAEAARGIEEHDEERALLDSAVKARDGFFTTFFVSPYSKYLARWAARRGLTPNQVTTASMLIGLVAAAAFATGERWGLVAGAVLLQVSFTTDCVDGQLARYTRTFSQLGAWLDSVFDRGKEYVVFAGLAIGASQAGEDVWLLAGAALTLQTVRHMLDFSFGDTQRQRFASAVRPPLEQPSDRLGGQVQPDEDEDEEDETLPFRRRALRSWRQLERSPAFLWPRKMIVFPIGERFAAISLTAALFTPRVTFIVLLAWGGLAAAYALTGRVLRSVNRTAHRGSRSASPDGEPGDPLAVYRDDGPLARALGRMLGRVVPLPAMALVVAGALPLLALIAFGSDVPVGVAAAAVVWSVLCGGIATGRGDGGRLRWAWPPAVRMCEYAGLLWLASLAGDSSLPAAFALLAAIAFRSYDLVYRLRARGETPPPWVDALSGGWDGRLLLGVVLLAVGALPAAYYVWAALAAVVFAGESVASWTSAADGGQALDPEGDE